MQYKKEIPGVTELTWRIKDLLEGEFSNITVRGEVSQPTQSANGHLYFTLKDSGASIACVAWKSTVQRLRLALSQGQQVHVSGDVQVYVPSGRYQIIVKSVDQAGEGALQQAFERLKQKLSEEGLFDAGRKKSLPQFPKTIGVVTSETGAAFQDIRSTLENRYPLAKVLLYHAAVQGVGAASEIARGIKWFSELGEVDVLIIGRGGGSLEDLWPFNEEIVARAIAGCPVPVVSAVGHETDFSISDFVADVRAATPTQAAMLVSPDIRDLRLTLDDYARRNERLVRNIVGTGKDTIRKMLKTHALLAIRDKMTFNKERIDRFEQRMKNQVESRLIRGREIVGSAKRTLPPTLTIQLMNGRKSVLGYTQSLENHVLKKKQLSHADWQKLHYRLQAVSPLEPLERGFTRILQDGKWIRRRTDFMPHKEIAIQWNDGTEEINSKPT